MLRLGPYVEVRPLQRSVELVGHWSEGSFRAGGSSRVRAAGRGPLASSAAVTTANVGLSVCAPWTLYRREVTESKRQKHVLVYN